MAAAYFLKIGIEPPEAILGDSKDKDHPGWVDILTFSEGLRQSAGHAPVMVDMNFTRRGTGLVSHQLLRAAASGRPFDRVILHLVDGDHWWDFRDVFVASYESQIATSETSSDTEKFSINYKSAKYVTGSPVLAAGAADACLGGLRDAATATARHMLRLHRISAQKER